MKIENLYEGQIFKNYNHMCEVLELEIKTSTNSKNSKENKHEQQTGNQF